MSDSHASSHTSRPALHDQPALWCLHLAACFLERIAPWMLVLGALVLLNQALETVTHRDSAPAAWLVLFSSVRSTRGFAFVFGLVGILYGLQQRNLRRAAEARAATGAQPRPVARPEADGSGTGAR